MRNNQYGFDFGLCFEYNTNNNEIKVFKILKKSAINITEKVAYIQMNLKQLNYIVEIADSQNISRAAERLFVSRPALNHYLISLEAELGMPLFKRIGHKLVPTYAGQLYIGAARQILDIRKQTYKQLEDLSGSKIGRIEVGITRGIGNSMFAKVFPKFNRRYPNHTVNLIEGNVRELEEATLEGKIDFCVVGSGSVESGLKHMVSAPCELVLVLPPEHRLKYLAAPPGAPYATLDLNMLRDEYFVLMNSETNVRAIADKHFRMAGFKPKVMLECSMSTLAYKMVLQGIGPSILMENQISAADGVYCFSLSPREIWYQSVAFREGAKFSKCEEYFIELVMQYFAETSPQQFFREP